MLPQRLNRSVKKFTATTKDSVGVSNAVAVDSKNRILIVYYDSGNSDLLYARSKKTK